MTFEEIDTLLNLKEEIIAMEVRIQYLKRADEIEMKLWSKSSSDSYLTTIDMNLNELDAIIQRDETILNSLQNKLSKYKLRENKEND